MSSVSFPDPTIRSTTDGTDDAPLAVGPKVPTGPAVRPCDPRRRAASMGLRLDDRKDTMAATRLGDHPDWWRVRDVMTTDVARLGPDATHDEIVDLLLARRVSGLPVTDEDGRLVGIVTEADLVTREAYGPGRRCPVDVLLDNLRNRPPAWVRKAAATTAADLMTRTVVTTSPDADLPTTARRLLESGHRRLPVIDADGRLVGIVSRRDLLAPAYGYPAAGGGD
jgi:CBS domain-containing protein